jgi:hypothetical protein
VVEAMPRINWNLLGPTRCGEYSHVDTAPRAAQWLDLMILQESKGVRPAVGGQVSDLIQKNGAGVRFSHPSFKVAIGTGEGAFDVTEQFGLNPLFRQGRAVYWHEWLVCSG